MRFLLSLGAAVAAACVSAGEPVYLDQGWTKQERQQFYYRAQGSEVVPYAWFLAMEEPWGEGLFRADAHMAGLRFIPQGKSAENPDGLPVGFTKGKGKDGAEWAGLTCAACHTGRLTHKGESVVVDGGTMLGDLLGFQSQLVAALRATAREDAKFRRFADRVLGPAAPPEKAAELRRLVNRRVVQMTDWEATSRPVHPSGFGVFDAVNILLNQINGKTVGAPDNFRVPCAPVSIPSVWGTDTYDSLLWNASVHNSLLRQTGEVIIVFGTATLKTTKAGLTLESSADVAALGEMYDHMKKLKPPPWPDAVLGKIDRDKAERGKIVYCEQKCADCHPLKPYPTVKNELGYSFVRTTATPIKQVKTDPLYAEYFVQRTAVPGAAAPFFKGSMFENATTMPAAVLFLGTLTAITATELAKYPPEEQKRLLGGRPLPTLPKSPAELDALVQSLLVYKATPLDGIWATAPYLHNGSVPSLYDLLQPPARRPKTFRLGNPEFDPAKVGYDPRPGKGLYEYDTALPGFTNAGHEYGTTISEEDRRALLEFLKTL